MSKLIIEMEMDGIPSCCGLCDPLFTVVCATKHDQTIDKMMLRVGRPSWCPICGVLPDEHGDLIDRSALIEDINKQVRLLEAFGIEDLILIGKELQKGMIAEINKQTPVIEAERKDDGTTVD